VFVAAFTASSTTSWAASVPKQGKIDVAVTDATTAKSLDLGGERTLYVLDSTLVARGDGADAVMHNTAGHCLAFEEVENATGAGRADARCTFVDGDGDKIHTTVKLARTSGKEEAKGTATITGGTGKYAGMSGELTQTRLLLGSPAEGVYPGAGRITGTYTIK
jgi:hypothetical protein